MKHGGNIYKAAKKLRCLPEQIIDFSSNINCYHPKTGITPTKTMLIPYADANYTKLKKTIAKSYALKPAQISLHSGATAAIFKLFESLEEKRVYLYAPLYGEYEKAAKKYNKNIVKINRFSNIDKRVKKNSIVVFVNPSTPEGKFYKLDKLFAMWQEQNCTIILDESFLEFEALLSQRFRIAEYKKLFIVQSFSKFYSCAGVRIGAVFISTKNVQKLHAPPWSISSFDAAFLQKRLSDTEFIKKSRKIHQKRKQELYRILEDSKLFDTIYASDANFFLTHSKHAKKLHKHLYDNKILTRVCTSFDFLTHRHIRFALKDTKAHKKLQKALHAFT